MTLPNAPPQHRSQTRGILVFLIGMLAFSGVIRVGLGVQSAQALVADLTSVPVASHAEADSCEPVPMALVDALRAREDRLDTRDAAISERMAALAMAEDLLDQRMAALEAAEAALAETLARADGASEGDLARLTEVYEAMKPKDAAQLFETMEAAFSAGFIGRMRPEAAAAVLSGMSPEAAYTISVLLAGRNARVPTE